MTSAEIIALDASAAYALLTDERWDDKVRASDELIAPDLIVPELLNARWKVAQSGALAPALDTVLGFLSRIRIVFGLPYAREAAVLADRFAHPVYDCLYVVVARHERAKLLTADTRFVRKLRRTPFADVLL